jgi:hypothetical protein
VKKFNPCLIVLFVLTAAGFASAQEPTAQGRPQAAANQVPLKVQLVVSRFQGEKKVSSTPYTLAIVANDNASKTSLRMGVDVAVPQTVFSGGGQNTSVPMTSYTYRSVGTNIDCIARSADGGGFKLDLTVADTSMFMTEKSAGNPSPTSGMPAFRSFTSSFAVLLKDGQTAQHTAATDSVSGEVLRVDVTLTVLK